MEELTVAAGALTIFILLLISIVWVIKTSKSETPRLPPGPRGLPIVGYLPFLQPNLHHQFTKLAHKHGPIYKLYLGSKLYIVISSPSLIKQVVRDHDALFANRDPPLAALVATQGLDIFWSPYGPYWRDMRKLFMRQMLSNKNLEASYVLRKEEVRKVIRNVNTTKIGEAIDVGELIFMTELNVILRLLWGGTMDAEKRDKLGHEFRDKMSKFVDLLGKPNVSDFFPGLGKFDVQGIEKEMRDVLPGVEGILDSVINQRMKMIQEEEVEESVERRNDFLGILLELKGQQVAERSFGVTEMKAILMDIVVGGTDTTATVVEWVMAELLHNPIVMEKVQQELTDVVGMNNIVEEFHISKLNYLDAVVKETFRLHPPLPLIVPRFPSQSCTVGGYTIPKGSRVFLNVWSVHNDPHVWEKPLEFKPERFLNESGKFDYIGNSFQYLPFGSGRRVCPGLVLGERMVMYFLASLVHSFEWRLPKGVQIDMSEKFGIVMRKNTSLFAIPSQRLPYLNLYA